MWRFIKIPTDLALRQYLVHTGDQMHIAPVGLHQSPFQLLRGRMATIHMQLPGKLLGVRRATNLRIPEGRRPSGDNRLASRASERRLKVVQTILRVG